MIEIIENQPVEPAISNEVIPSQLFPVWRNIINNSQNEGFSIVIREGDELKEKLDFYILNRAFGRFMVSIPYALYGSCLSESSRPHLKEFFTVLEDFARDQGCLTMSVCTHPLSGIGFDEFNSYFDYKYYYTNFCQFAELDVHPLDKMKSKRRAAFKNEISKIEGSSEFSLIKEPDAYEFNEWLNIFKNRYSEIGAIPYPDWFFRNLYRASIESNLIDFRVLRTETEIMGGIFFVRGRNIVDYFSSAFDLRWNKYYPTTFVLNEYFRGMVSEGVKYFNWQSSPVKGEGVYNYKRRWGAYDIEHYYYSKELVSESEIFKIPLTDLKKECVGCYILPYSLWDA